jgi:hypothetical protein
MKSSFAQMTRNFENSITTKSPMDDPTGPR